MFRNPEIHSGFLSLKDEREARIEKLELVEAQDTLVDLSGLLARAYDFDHVTERRDDEHLDGLRKHRPPDDDAWLQFTRVHLSPPVTVLRFMAGLPLISGQELSRTQQRSEVAEVLTLGVAMKYSVIRTIYDPKSSCRIAMQRDDFGPGLDLVEIVRPLLHHLPPLGKMRRPVVGSSIWITHGVSKLVLDVVGAHA